jgi:hypothetical protein
MGKPCGFVITKYDDQINYCSHFKDIFSACCFFNLGLLELMFIPVGNGFVACRVASCGHNAKSLTLKSEIYNPYCRPWLSFFLLVIFFLSLPNFVFTNGSNSI